MKLGGDSPVRHFGSLALLIHVEILLVSCLFQCGPRDALADLLVPHPRLAVRSELLAIADFEAVHLGFKATNSMIGLPFVSSLKNPTCPLFGSFGELRKLG